MRNKKQILLSALILSFLHNFEIEAMEELLPEETNIRHEQSLFDFGSKNEQIIGFSKPVFPYRFPSKSSGYVSLYVRGSNLMPVNLKDFSLSIQIGDHHQLLSLSKKDVLLVPEKKKIVKVRFTIPPITTDMDVKFIVKHLDIPVLTEQARLKIDHAGYSDVEIESENASEDEEYVHIQTSEDKDNVQIAQKGSNTRMDEENISEASFWSESEYLDTPLEREIFMMPRVLQPKGIVREGETINIEVPVGLYSRDDHVLRLDTNDPRLKMEVLPKQIEPTKISTHGTVVVAHLPNLSQTQVAWNEPFLRPENITNGMRILNVLGTGKSNFKQFSLSKKGRMPYRVGKKRATYLFDTYLFTIPKGTHQSNFKSKIVSSDGWTASKSSFYVYGGDPIDTRLEIGLKIKGHMNTLYLSGYPIYGFSNQAHRLELLNFNIDIANKHYSIMLENGDTGESDRVEPFRRYQESLSEINSNEEYEVYLMCGTYEKNDDFEQEREVNWEILGEVDLF